MDAPTLNLENKLLVATPAMRDPRFRGAVIYVCQHAAPGSEGGGGAMGIVVNRAKRVSSGHRLRLSEVLNEIGVEGEVRVADTPVLAGGPVDMERGFVLHSHDYQIPEATLPLSDTLALTSTRDVLDALVSERAPSRAVLAIGYAGWGEGQLEAELGENAWLVVDAENGAIDDIVFAADHDSKWADALGELGVSPASLSAAAGSA